MHPMRTAGFHFAGVKDQQAGYDREGMGVPQMGKNNPNFGTIHLTDRRRISLLEATALVPIGIGGRLVAGRIQFGKLSRGEVPAYGAQILP